MKKYKLLGGFIFAILLIPVISWGFGSSITGTCVQDKWGANGDQICQIDGNAGQTRAHIKWNLSENYSSKAFCYLETYDNGWDYFAPAKTANKYPVNNKVGYTNFRAEDDVYIRDPGVMKRGTARAYITFNKRIYRTTCCKSNGLSGNNEGCTPIAKDLNLTHSPKRTVTSKNTSPAIDTLGPDDQDPLINGPQG